MKKKTAEWVKIAEEGFTAAKKLLRGRNPLHALVCFHCQQCAEKYFKALLQELSVTFPYTHDLVELVDLLLPHHPFLRKYRRNVKYLTNYAVDVRYPGKRIRKRQAESAMRWAEQIRKDARSLLGIRPRKRRKKKSP